MAYSLIQGAIFVGVSPLVLMNLNRRPVFIDYLTRNEDEKKNLFLQSTLWGAAAGYGTSLIWPDPGWFKVLAVSIITFWGFKIISLYDEIQHIKF